VLSLDTPDFATIVIGSGIAGLFVALEARRLGPVLVLTKGSIDDCNTRWAQGGIAAAVGAGDSPAEHLADTLAAGAGLVDEEAARILCEEAPARIADLITYGVGFDDQDGVVALGREAAHSQNRILHAGGDRTGAAIETALADASRQDDVRVFDDTVATRLLTSGGRVVGVEGMDLHSGDRIAFQANAVVIASGGAGQLFSHTTNPDVATGDGIALAANAGAELTDLEFTQFHPTALRLPGAAPFLISEAVRGEGATLRNAAGEPFMTRYHPLRDLAPRDVVARAIVNEMRAANADHVVLDCTGIRGVDLAARFPGIFATCRAVGIDIRTTPIPVAPAAHYLMGGIRTDTWGRTTVPGLYACGECACTGVHGANRLASNSLMETVVFGKRVVEHMEAGAGGAAAPAASALPLPALHGVTPSHAALQELMWGCAGIERDAEGLRRAIDTVASWGADAHAPEPTAAGRRAAAERASMTTLASIVLDAALRREESRGAHFRSDFPERDDLHWKRRQVYRRAH
jgi:L-aspartate oxidase